jgi:hypothetical protein
MDHPQVKAPLEVKAPLGANGANDNGRPEDDLVLVTLGIHRTLSGLAAPVDLLAAVLPPDAPGATIEGRPIPAVP